MAFSTIQGSGTPDSFVGTSGVDTISLVNSLGDFVLTAFADDDDVQFLGSGNAPAIVDATLKGGDGDDSFTGYNLLFSNVFVNGNEDDDILGFGTSTFANSALKGGKGDDEFEVEILNQSLINGNIGDDDIDLDFVTSSSVFGGQGVDDIRIVNDLIDSVVNGDDGNDDIDLHTGAFISSTVYGGDGQDTIDAAQSTSGVVISGDAGNDNLIGSDYEDIILGGDDNDTITGGLQADTLTGATGINTYVYGTNAVSSGVATGVVATGVVDSITDFTDARDLIDANGAAGTSSTVAYATAGVGTYAAALTAADLALTGNFDYSVQAVGSDTTWTAYLFIDSPGVGTASGAIQLGTTGQFGTAALAVASIDASQII